MTVNTSQGTSYTWVILDILPSLIIKQSREVSEYLFRGADIANKHAQVFDGLLIKESIPIPASPILGVTDFRL